MYLASINLRINVESDLNHAWPYRKSSMIEFILKHHFDLIGFQEASPSMVEDLKAGLSHLYDCVFTPRDERGEGTPLFYLKKYQPLEVGTKWLTNTPDVSSNMKGSHFPRIVTYARFPEFIFFNTHLDYASDEVCLKQATYLVEIINKVKGINEPLILTGDFNMTPESKTIGYLKEQFLTFYDEPHINLLTYHAFSDQTLGKPIDYIFYQGHIKPRNFTIHHHEKKGFYISDHYPISVHFDFI